MSTAEKECQHEAKYEWLVSESMWATLKTSQKLNRAIGRDFEIQHESQLHWSSLAAVEKSIRKHRYFKIGAVGAACQNSPIRHSELETMENWGTAHPPPTVSPIPCTAPFRVLPIEIPLVS